MFNAMKNGLLYRLCSRVPDRTKRLIALSSLAVVLPPRSELFDQNAMRKLNDLMKLGHEPRALELPVRLTHAIWQDDKRREIVRYVETQAATGDTRSAAEFVLTLLPEWLKYGQKEAMTQDVEKLIIHRFDIVS